MIFVEYFCRELLQKFQTQELIHWKEIEKNFEEELKLGTKDDPTTNVFNSTEEGKQRWTDFKARVVEHVNYNFHLFSFDIEFVSLF